MITPASPSPECQRQERQLRGLTLFLVRLLISAILAVMAWAVYVHLMHRVDVELARAAVEAMK